MLLFDHSKPESFWVAGYECADHLNKFGNRVNLLQQTGHLIRLHEDYADLREAGIGAMREGICWSEVEKTPYRYDWTTVTARILAAQEMGLVQYWDLCHFGFPDDLTPLHPHFSRRFVALCEAFIRHYRELAPEGILTVTPINEISFLSWLGGDAYGTSPFCVRQGWEVKYHLCKAFIKGVRAMRRLDDSLLILSTEPLINVIALSDTREEQELASRLNEEQHQAVDMLTGRICPELGGWPGCIDIVGANFYFHNQWNVADKTPLPWASHERHPRWEDVHRLLAGLYDRYDKPLLIAETSHMGNERGPWLEHMAEECMIAIRRGIPVQGLCLYPIIDRPDWDFPFNWHRSGLWDETAIPAEGAPKRLICTPYLLALKQAQRDLRLVADDLRFFHFSNSNDNPMCSTKSPFDVRQLPKIIICFSHLRWDFVYQRPQHILSRLARDTRVLFIEEPVFTDGPVQFRSSDKGANLTVLIPQLPHDTAPEEAMSLQKALVDNLVESFDGVEYGVWYYTPMALSFSRHLKPVVTVFDCMDELSAFRFAPPELLSLEQELLERADVVFTGGASLYKAKKDRHANLHLFASSIDVAHFAKGRIPSLQSDERKTVTKLGFFGVIDERFDTQLLAGLADARPEWEFEIIGPVVKIDPASLPKNPNILYTGARQYEELPQFIRDWDIAMLPFALNDSTRFISPTKTPEYLAAGKPVISTPICDVVTPYGDLGLVHIAATVDEWLAAADQALAGSRNDKAWLEAVDAFLKGSSWDKTVAAMKEKIIESCHHSRLPLQEVTVKTLDVSDLVNA